MSVGLPVEDPSILLREGALQREHQTVSVNGIRPVAEFSTVPLGARTHGAHLRRRWIGEMVRWPASDRCSTVLVFSGPLYTMSDPPRRWFDDPLCGPNDCSTCVIKVTVGRQQLLPLKETCGGEVDVTTKRQTGG